MSYQLIESTAALDEMLQREAGAKAVMVDTEFMRQDTFYPQAALIQLYFSDTAWLIDPLAVEDMTPLGRLFEDSSVIKVLHSASEDLEVFQHFLGVQPLPLFDSQRAAAFTGMDFGLGYRALVQQISAIEISKEETRSNWLRRPLSEQQLQYAALDVIHLKPVYELLTQQLEQSGKLEWLLEEGAEAVRNASAQVPPAYTRLKSAWKLKPPQLSVLAVLSQWRDDRARQLDKPRNWILHDKVCQKIAETCPADMRALQDIEDLPASVLRKQGETLLQLIAEGIDGEEGADLAQMPAPLNGAQRDCLKRVKQASKVLAQEWHMAPEALLPARDYELLVRCAQQSDAVLPERWHGWRKERLIEPLMRVARGKL
jgi:ribonuclease D